VLVLPRHGEMGAFGVALLARDAMHRRRTRFKGFGTAEAEYEATSFECKGCPNVCEIVEIRMEGQKIARWGGRCDRWEVA
jgi:hypothetical protein